MVPIILFLIFSIYYIRLKVTPKYRIHCFVCISLSLALKFNYFIPLLPVNITASVFLERVPVVLGWISVNPPFRSIFTFSWLFINCSYKFFRQFINYVRYVICTVWVFLGFSNNTSFAFFQLFGNNPPANCLFMSVKQ